MLRRFFQNYKPHRRLFILNFSCGLIFGASEPRCVNFSEACRSSGEWINHQPSPINRMVEAPLSVAFDLEGNPIPRKVEKLASQTRPGYSGPGATVLIATLHLVTHLRDHCPEAFITLFEGFVSFKPPEAKSDHIWDAVRLSDSIRSGPNETVEFWGEEDLVSEGTVLRSVFVPWCFDPGIPQSFEFLGEFFKPMSAEVTSRVSEEAGRG